MKTMLKDTMHIFSAGPYLILSGVFAGSFLLSCQSSSFIQIFVTNFAFKPLQIHKDLIKMFPVKLARHGGKKKKKYILAEYICFIANDINQYMGLDLKMNDP